MGLWAVLRMGDTYSPYNCNRDCMSCNTGTSHDFSTAVLEYCYHGRMNHTDWLDSCFTT